MTRPRFIVTSDDMPPMLREGVVAIGNFDGVHRGHQAVIGAAKEAARNIGGAALALTFEPHPRQFFRPDVALFRLTPAETKAKLVKACGLDGMVVLPFDAALAGLEPEKFVGLHLHERLAARHVVVGHDFHFGKARAGTPEKLGELGLTHGFNVSVMGPRTDEHGAPFSSSRVRESLAAGAMPEAADVLGYRWFVEGAVIHGEKRGRQLGYPTANMQLDEAVTLKHGIYAVRVRVDETVLGGVANYGRRPQFDHGAPLLEPYIFDFSGDLYGQTIAVEFVEFLRPEARFDSIDALIAQMDRDQAAARDRLAAVMDAPFGPEALALNRR